jgi:hypothetical protein
MTKLSKTIALVLLSAACAGGRNEDRAATPRRPASASVAEPAPAPRVHQELTAAVKRLSSGAIADQEVKRQALVALAHALESTVVNETFTGDTVRELASGLGRAPTTPRAGQRFHEAFTSVLATLAASSSPASTTVTYRRALSALASAVNALGDGKGLTDHADEVVAFRAATDAVFLLGGHTPPFHQAAEAGAERSNGLKSYEAEVAEARRDVVELARTSWPQAHIAAARALTALADAVELIEACDPSADAATVRFEARRMRWTRGAGVLQSRSIQTGLSVVLDVLERVETAASAGATKAARVALGNVNPYGSLAFQRAAVQDAFRATMGVFTSLEAPSKRSCVRATRPAGDSRDESGT